MLYTFCWIANESKAKLVRAIVLFLVIYVEIRDTIHL
jgi:hypothetical protein